MEYLHDPAHSVIGTLQVSCIALITVSTIFSIHIPQLPVVCAYMYILCICQRVPPLSPSQAAEGKTKGFDISHGMRCMHLL